MEEEFLRLLRDRLLQLFMTGTTGQQVAAGVNAVAGRGPQHVTRLSGPRDRKGAEMASKRIHRDRAATRGVSVQEHPVETVRPDLPVTSGSGISRIEHSSRRLTPAEMFRHLNR